MRHEVIEKSLNLMVVLIVVAISIGGLIEIVPLMMSSDATEPTRASRCTARCASPAATSTSAKAATTATRR